MTVNRSFPQALFRGASVGMILLLLLLGSIATARAFTLGGVSGAWSNPRGEGATLAGNVVYQTANGERLVYWGNGNTSVSNKSGFGFLGSTNVTFDPGNEFQIGRLRHFNRPVNQGTGLTGVDLQVTLAFSDPAGVTSTHDFTFAIDETPNTSASCCSDIISFPESYSQETLTLAGRKYALQVVGFKTSPTASATVSQLVSPENAITTAYLFGAIVDVTPGVEVSAPLDGSLFRAGADQVNVSAVITDPLLDGNDSHACAIDWDGDGIADAAGAVVETDASGASETCSASRLFVASGVYTVDVTVDDGEGGVATDSVMLVVYDPSDGFVTGGGKIVSPAGAYSGDPTASGNASFGFVSKYQRGATAPSGATHFQFDIAGLTFDSDAYEWLIVNQAGTNAQFRGEGTINDEPSPNGLYKFMVWAGDGATLDASDTFRIKIWWEDATGAEQVVYDNGTSQPIASGSIVIHKK